MHTCKPTKIQSHNVILLPTHHDFKGKTSYDPFSTNRLFNEHSSYIWKNFFSERYCDSWLGYHNSSVREVFASCDFMLGNIWFLTVPCMESFDLLHGIVWQERCVWFYACNRMESDHMVPCIELFSQFWIAFVICIFPVNLETQNERTKNNS